MNKDDHLIDNYLENMPLTSLPTGFVQNTMHRVLVEKHFHLRFIDFILPAFALFFLPLVVGLVWWIYTQIDPFWLAQMKLELHFQWLILPHNVKTLALVLLPIAGLASLAVLAGGVLALLSTRANLMEN